MIVSVSRRTDIPAFFSRWFIHRMREGYVMVRNPMNYHQVSKIDLSSNAIDCVVFWTKNAKPLLPFIDEIKEMCPFYFQYTLNAYGAEIEQHVPDLAEKIQTLQTLANMIGRERMVWRYDPIVLSERYDVDWHLNCFEMLAAVLSPCVDRCIFSFLDMYPKIEKTLSTCSIGLCEPSEMVALAKGMAEIGKKYQLRLKTCAEIVNLEAYGITHNQCIDPEMISNIAGYEIAVGKDKNQRPACGCAESVDIGQYNTCRHGCRYCYANFNPQSVATLTAQHKADSPLLIGTLREGDNVTERKMKSLKGKSKNVTQLSLL